jgi:hypothetical protein
VRVRSVTSGSKTLSLTSAHTRSCALDLQVGLKIHIYRLAKNMHIFEPLSLCSERVNVFTCKNAFVCMGAPQILRSRRMHIHVHTCSVHMFMYTIHTHTQCFVAKHGAILGKKQRQRTDVSIIYKGKFMLPVTVTRRVIQVTSSMNRRVIQVTSSMNVYQ